MDIKFNCRMGLFLLNTPPNIRSAISAVFGSTAPSSSVQSWVNNNYTKTAVDCSGLAYYVLNEASGGKVRPWFENKLGMVGKLTYAHGILAGHFTDINNGTKITRAQDISAGCTMKFDGHLLVIYSVTKGMDGLVTKISYAHSNYPNGPHKGYITIGNPMWDLNASSQTWHDEAYSDGGKSLYIHTVKLTCLP